MNIPEDRHYFTINEFAKACGLSRASLIRLEKSGFIKPCRIDSVTGYRYYDAVNATEVAQYKFTFISDTYETSSIIFTTNKEIMDWAEMVGNPVLTTALLDIYTEWPHAGNC